MNAQLKHFEPIAGLFFDEPYDTYHVKREGEISSSALKRILRSPLHYRHWLRETGDDTAAMAFGRAFHCALFEPRLFKENYTTTPDDAPKKPGKSQRQAKNPSADTVIAIQWWDRWNLENDGKIVIDCEDLERIEEMIASVNAHPWAKLLIRGGEAEVSLRWIDEETGLHCKARADYFVDGEKRWVVDAKSCTDASPEEFARAVHKYCYHLQSAHYTDGFRILGKPLDNYFLIAVESEAPFACMVYAIDAAAEARGHELRNRGVARMKDCIESGNWPAYSTDITPLALAPWALKDHTGETA